VELAWYRAAFRTIMEELLAAEPATFAGATADGLAAVVVSWIQGCAVQAMTDPERFGTEEYLAAVRGMVGQLAGGDVPNGKLPKQGSGIGRAAVDGRQAMLWQGRMPADGRS
jgi:hypothetical protein